MKYIATSGLSDIRPGTEHISIRIAGGAKAAFKQLGKGNWDAFEFLQQENVCEIRDAPTVFRDFPLLFSARIILLGFEGARAPWETP